MLDPKNFQNPDKFFPERFISESTGEYTPPPMFAPFGRRCQATFCVFGEIMPRYLKLSRGNTAHNPKNVGTSSHNLLQKCSHTQNVLMRGFRGQVMGRVVVGAT